MTKLFPRSRSDDRRRSRITSGTPRASRGAARSGNRRSARATARRGALLLLGVAALLALPVSSACADDDDDPFEIIEVASRGRVVAADLVDLDGDGTSELLRAVIRGIPPDEERILQVYRYTRDAGFSEKPAIETPIPAGSAVYDLGDVRDDAPGHEVIFLRRSQVTLLSLATAEVQRWDYEIPGASSVGAEHDERGLERFKMLYHEFGEKPWIWVPQLGEFTALGHDGTVLARLDAGARANFFVPPQPGFVSVESNIQLFLDPPRFSAGDVDGDARPDIVTSTRHEVRVFLNKEERGFAKAPDRVIPLRLVGSRDHIRGSGGVSTDARDINGDGLLDLLISHTQGSFADATATTKVILNRGGEWHLDSPDRLMRVESTIVSDVLVDLDGDSRMELVRLEIPFGVLELVETLISQEIDVNVAIYRFDAQGIYGEDPWVKRKLEVAWSFDTFRPEGFMPSLFQDLNADRHLDFVDSGGGDAIEVFLGGPARKYKRRNAWQKLQSEGQIRFGHLDADELPDFVLFDPNNFDRSVRVGRNRGVLPGTPPRMEPRAPTD